MQIVSFFVRIIWFNLHDAAYMQYILPIIIIIYCYFWSQLPTPVSSISRDSTWISTLLLSLDVSPFLHENLYSIDLGGKNTEKFQNKRKWEVQLFFFLIFLNVYLLLKERQRQRDRGWAGEGQREGDTEFEADSRLQAVSTRGSNPQTMRSWPEPKWALNQLSHPGALRFSSF